MLRNALHRDEDRKGSSKGGRGRAVPLADVTATLKSARALRTRRESASMHEDTWTRAYDNVRSPLTYTIHAMR